MFLADLALAVPGDRLKELVPDPELKPPVGHEDVALAAAVVLAHAMCCQSTQTTPLRATLRATHCSPLRSGCRASSRRLSSPWNRLEGVISPSDWCGRCVL